MVKGSSRQVVVVKSPEENLFEQAIFFVKEDAFRKTGITAEGVVAEAQKVANQYMQKDSVFSSSSGVHGLIWLLLGASGASFLWGLGIYLFL